MSEPTVATTPGDDSQQTSGGDSALSGAAAEPSSKWGWLCVALLVALVVPLELVPIWVARSSAASALLFAGLIAFMAASILHRHRGRLRWIALIDVVGILIGSCIASWSPLNLWAVVAFWILLLCGVPPLKDRLVARYCPEEPAR